MKLKRLWINGFKNLYNFEISFENNNGLTILIGNNGSGKSNVLEAISSIFIGLYKFSTPNRKPTFEYEIEYILNNKNYHISLIKIQNNMTYSFHIDLKVLLAKDFKKDIDLHLPSQLIASYSGEEIRLWENYYKYAYSDFLYQVKKLGVGNPLPEQKLFFVDKNYWNEGLLVLMLSELDFNKKFIKNNLNINEIIKITLYFNTSKIVKYQDNTITTFIKQLNPTNNKSIDFSLDELKQKLTDYERTLLIKLISSTQSNLINQIRISFKNCNNIELFTEDLSEGQKKQILLRTILEFIANDNSLILLDEPDSHVHVANKLQIKSLINEYEKKELILTTHSPTLMNIFENNLTYLENGQIQSKEKAEILKEISDDLMSYSEQQIVLNSNNDILLVEGKHDIKFIKTAINKLDDSRYNDLRNLEFVPTGGASGLRLFIDKFKAKDNQNIIAILDYDKAGKSEIKEILNDEYKKTLETKGFVKINEFKNTFLLFLPKLERISDTQYEIEDFFPLDKLIAISKEQIDKFKVLKNFKLEPKTLKTKLNEKCESYEKDDFKDFKQIFELLLKIKEPQE